MSAAVNEVTEVNEANEVTEVDVVVIGLGPGGEALASSLAKEGLKVVAIDQHLVGGECPYYGCVPSKMMIRAADLLAEGRRIPAMAGNSVIEPDWHPVATRIADEATDHWNDQVAVDRLVDAGVQFVRGHGRLAGERTVEIGGQTFQAERGVVLNTGTSPGVPPIPGLADTPYWTNRDAVQLTDLPASLIVIGGGAIGCELSQVFARFGVSVTVVEVADRILALEEPEASKVVSESFGRDGIQVLVGGGVAGVGYAEGRFTVTLEAGEELAADKLLVAAGRSPNLSDVGLETVGLDPSARTVDTDDEMRAGDGLWAIGDITGKGAFTHMSVYQSAIAAASVLGRDDGQRAEYHAVPRVTFTDPEVGSVGLTEQQARDKGINVRTGFTDITKSTRGWIHKVGNEGFIKLVEDVDRGVLVGATSAGPNGGEILAGLAVAVHAGVTTDRLRAMIYAYPTLHRAIEEALKDLAA
jgi:pyruvate/2-oxoglutarate dehydrogenase complex dihydrolipoamide dehydrogenase (E3) component